MKTLSKHFRKICTWAFVAALAGLAGVAQGQVKQVVITENSSTSLTATLNGNPLTLHLTSPDQWQVSFLGSGTLAGGVANWADPENPTIDANQVEVQFDELYVFSDLNNSGITTYLPNGATDTTDFTLNGAQLDVTFNDNGDTPSSVPDAARTFSLLGLSLATLVILKRSRLCSQPRA